MNFCSIFNLQDRTVLIDGKPILLKDGDVRPDALLIDQGSNSAGSGERGRSVGVSASNLNWNPSINLSGGVENRRHALGNGRSPGKCTVTITIEDRLRTGIKGSQSRVRPAQFTF